MAPTIRDLLLVALWLIPGGLALASEETAIEVFQPIITEDQICVRRVTYVTHSSGVDYWGGFVDYTCEPNATVTDSDHPEDRNAASVTGIKAWVDPYHFQEQGLYGDTVRVYVDLRHLDASKVRYDVVSATMECVLANATASRSGWVRKQESSVDAKHLRVIVLGTPEQVGLSRTYRFKDLSSKVPRKTEFEE